MKLLAWVLLFVLPLAAKSPPPWEWRWSNPQPTANNLIGVFFLDSLRGILVADNGETARTADGGETWIPGTGRVPENTLVEAATRDGKLLLAAAVDGRIWKSEDAGRSWRNPVSMEASLYDIALAEGGAALAVGAHGLIARSADGGNTWLKVRSDSLGPQLFGLHCGRDGFAMAVGEAGTILKSLDTGKTWALLPKPPTAPFLTSVAFADTARGFATTEDGRLLDTRDGGRNWNASTLDPLAFLRGIRLDDRNLTVTGSDGSLWKSADGGDSWTRSHTGASAFLASAALAGAGNEIIVGNAGTLLKSPDGGRTWIRKQVGTMKEVLGLAVLAPGNWLAFGAEGLIYRTRNGGYAWDSVASPVAARFLSGSFLGRRGLLGGFGGTLLRSGDEGETWTAPPVPAGLGTLYGVAWCDSATALAVGDSGVLLRSVDGGGTWMRLTDIPGLTKQTLSAVACRSTGAAYAVGYQGRILKSIDRGASWKTVPSGVTHDLFGFAFHDDALGMAVGARGTVLVTRDAGETWVRESTGSGDDYVYGVAWLGRDTAVAVSEWVHYAKAYLTTDGGKTWQDLPNPTRNAFWAIAGADSGQVAVMGQSGTILVGKFAPQSVGIRSRLARGGRLDMMRAARMGSLPWIRISFTTSIRGPVKILAYDLGGRSLGVIYAGESAVGPQSLLLPFSRRGPVVLTLVGGGRERETRSCLLEN
jgi:photosystem II stability/assembly factor-like uncharacterized protein